MKTLLLALVLADQPAQDPRIEVAEAVVAVVGAELAEARAEAEYYKAKLRKITAAAELEARKKKLPGWKEGAQLAPDFSIAKEPKK